MVTKDGRWAVYQMTPGTFCPALWKDLGKCTAKLKSVYTLIFIQSGSFFFQVEGEKDLSENII